MLTPLDFGLLLLILVLAIALGVLATRKPAPLPDAPELAHPMEHTHTLDYITEQTVNGEHVTTLRCGACDEVGLYRGG